MKKSVLRRIRVVYTLKILTRNPVVLMGMIIAAIIVLIALFSHLIAKQPLLSCRH
jgi:hypothetical protein